MEAGTVFDHVGFVTPSIEGSVHFWRDVMGMNAHPWVERKGAWVSKFTGVSGGHLKIAHLFGFGLHMELLEFSKSAGPSDPPSSNQVATGHVCFKVPDLQEAYERIRKAGGRAVGQVATVTEGPAAGLTGLYMQDPYGVLIELHQAT